MVGTYLIPAMERQRQAKFCVFEASLVYIVSSWPVRTTTVISVSKSINQSINPGTSYRSKFISLQNEPKGQCFHLSTHLPTVLATPDQYELEKSLWMHFYVVVWIVIYSCSLAEGENLPDRDSLTPRRYLPLTCWEVVDSCLSEEFQPCFLGRLQHREWCLIALQLLLYEIKYASTSYSHALPQLHVRTRPVFWGRPEWQCLEVWPPSLLQP